MFKKIFILFIFLLPFLQFAQDFSALWKGYFSYFNITDVVRSESKIYAAAENAIFIYDINTQEIEELTTINGLSGNNISTLSYSDAYDLLLIGYEDGLIEVVLGGDDNVLTIVDILDKPTISPSDKRINHFNTFNNLVYISTDYGISVFDLERLEFGDTYFIGSGGSQIPVNQTTIFGAFIYAACGANNGIKKAQFNNPNLIDFQSWQTLFSGNYLFIETNDTKMYTVSNSRIIYDISSESLTQLFQYTDIPKSVKATEGRLVVSTPNNVFVYNESSALVSQIPVGPNFSTAFNTAVLSANNIYIGTEDFGLLKTNLNNTVIFEEIHPDGPLMNIPFSIEAESNGVWVTYGEYTVFFNPYPLNKRGVSHLKNDKWINTRYDGILENDTRCLNNIAINPVNRNQVFISSFFDGLLEVNDEIPTILYNQSNSTLEDLIIPNLPDYIGDMRIGASAFDENNVLWITNTGVDDPLKSFNPSSNQWNSYTFTDIIADGFNDEIGYSSIVISNDGTKWVGGHLNGIIGYNENRTPKIKNIKSEDKNMPSTRVYALALDNRNQLWIGTDLGLRVLYNTSNFFEDDNIQVDEIIIEEDGIAKELLFQQLVTVIKVDGSNNKWIGTADSGLFYFSSDGQNTIFHFTKENSPLPSNTINDVSLDKTNGIVYIATSKGLVSFLSGGSNTVDDFTSAYAYPNPVRPRFDIVEEKVKIKELPENVNIKITDIEGNLVAEAQSRTNQRYNGFNLEIDGGIAYWNGKNLANNVVASGVYLIMLSDLDSFETKVLKLMVVR